VDAVDEIVASVPAVNVAMVVTAVATTKLPYR
jgi:hypothetical protein